jgi:hypothetical protein
VLRGCSPSKKEDRQSPHPATLSPSQQKKSVRQTRGCSVYDAIMVSGLQVVVDRENLWIAHYGHVCIIYPRGHTDAALITDVGRGVNILHKKVPTGIGLLMLIGLGSPPPAGEDRSAAMKMFGDFEPKLKAMCSWVEGEGFVAAAKRSVLTLLMSRALRTKPVKGFSQIAQATDWMESQGKLLKFDCPTSEELQLAIEQSRQPKK